MMKAGDSFDKHKFQQQLKHLTKGQSRQNTCLDELLSRLDSSRPSKDESLTAKTFYTTAQQDSPLKKRRKTPVIVKRASTQIPMSNSHHAPPPQQASETSTTSNNNGFSQTSHLCKIDPDLTVSIFEQLSSQSPKNRKTISQDLNPLSRNSMIRVRNTTKTTKRRLTILPRLSKADKYCIPQIYIPNVKMIEESRRGSVTEQNIHIDNQQPSERRTDTISSTLEISHNTSQRLKFPQQDLSHNNILDPNQESTFLKKLIGKKNKLAQPISHSEPDYGEIPEGVLPVPKAMLFRNRYLQKLQGVSRATTAAIEDPNRTHRRQHNMAHLNQTREKLQISPDQKQIISQLITYRKDIQELSSQKSIHNRESFGCLEPSQEQERYLNLQTLEFVKCREDGRSLFDQRTELQKSIAQSTPCFSHPK
ncbi:hypothetical protein FGO68_gene2400 [Halteria grandinella]|uniref:Uncharacterized protein n=1 Tax=Halteria grandinella TaxID=5974 RepID=A0A8J8T1B0_HALGN|nr:hypothetical protein FGO68_gene2400 [Halteria grandinella]